MEEVLLGHSWTEAAVSMLIKELLEAVNHIHEEGIVHLDIQVCYHYTFAHSAFTGMSFSAPHIVSFQQPDNIIFPRGTSSRSAGLEGLMHALSSLSGDTSGAGGRSDLGVVSCFVKLTGFSMAQPVFNRVSLQLASIMPPTYWCPDFAAPELLKTTKSTADNKDEESGVGSPADVWSVGILTYLL